MIFLRGLIAIGVIALGFYVYPFYTDNILAPLIAIANSLNPDQNIFESTYLSALPLVLFLLILFFGIMILLGKAGSIGRSDKP